MLISALNICILGIILLVLCISTSERGQKQWKTFENYEKRTFSIMYTRGSCNAHEEKQENSKWATSFWVSTSFRESLPIADQQSFFFIFLHVSYMSLSCTWWKRYFFIIFKCVLSFSTMRTRAQACAGWSKYTTYQGLMSLEIRLFGLRTPMVIYWQVIEIGFQIQF